MTRRPRSAFTLLEVMASVLILGLILTSLYASEAGAIKMKHRTVMMGMASLLARCKMGEIEEQIANEGLPAVFASGSDECCEEAEIDNFSCEWEINRIELPETMFAEEETEQEGLLEQETPASDIETEDPMELLAGPSAAEMDGITAQAMQYVYPILKPSIEEQIRRVTVKVKWQEGNREHDFSVTQYLVAEQPAVEDLEGEEPGAETSPGGVDDEPTAPAAE
jgi:general secretion pathway protein I